MNFDTISVVPLCDMNEYLQKDWLELAESLDINYSLYPGWSYITAESHDIDTQCVLLTVRDAEDLIGIFPALYSQVRDVFMTLKTMELIGNKVSYHNNLVTRLTSSESISLLISQAEKQGADVVHLASIPDESELGRYLLETPTSPEYLSHTISGESSPYLRLEKTWEELLATKPKKFRYKIRKRANSLNSNTALQMKWFGSPGDCDALFEAINIVEDNSWKKSAGVSIFESAREKKYYELLLPYLSERRAMFANVLFHNHLPIAYNLCCVWNGWVGQMKTSFDTRYADLSPGALVIDFAIQHAFSLNAFEFDFLGDTDRHKLAWTKNVRSHSDHFLYLRSSSKGNLIGLLKGMKKRIS